MTSEPADSHTTPVVGTPREAEQSEALLREIIEVDNRIGCSSAGSTAPANTPKVVNRADPDHLAAIVALLEASHASVRAYAEKRYPNDVRRQDALAAIVFQDAAFGVKLGIDFGFGLSRAIDEAKIVLAQLIAESN